MRIAMWSGPRNLSTAMMYSFGARSDFAVQDEPFYAAYLAQSGIDHPMRDEIISSQQPDPQRVARQIMEPIQDGKENLYLKLMSHHMLEGFPLGWSEACVNIHLIRHPARVVASYAAKREAPTLDDLGFRQQLRVFEEIGGLVIDSSDIRDNPASMIKLLCKRIHLHYDPMMLSWPKGGHASDGIWAKHWYGAVHASTGFSGAEGPLPTLTGEFAELSEASLPYYEQMAACRLR